MKKTLSLTLFGLLLVFCGREALTQEKPATDKSTEPQSTNARLI